MTRRAELLALLLSDAVALALAFLLFRTVGLSQGWMTGHWAAPGGSIAFSVLFGLGWLVLFFFAGLYRERYAASRFDELVTLLKVVSVGSLLFFFGVFLDRLNPDAARSGIVVYWASLLGFTGAGRLAVRAVQKAQILRGHGVHKAVIVGWGDRVEALYRDVARYPAAGLRVVGAVRLQPHGVPAGPPVHTLTPANGGLDLPEEAPAPSVSGDALPAGDVEVVPSGSPTVAVHTISELPGLIDRLGVQDVLIALGPGDHAYLDEVLRVCDGRPVALKLVPDFYTLIGGMARTEHIYGLPLIEVLPEPIPAWEKSTKRLVDIAVSALVLLLGLPLWLLIWALVRITSHGPAIYRQTRVGRHGRTFTIYKFRTMVDGAERETGPVWARKGDERVTRFGAVLRRWRLDEIPQFWNVLKGEMSLVGPRPERPFFVEQHARFIPLYSRRHRVQPGITGLAQVKWRYDGDLEDVRQKLKYDLFYIENMSLRMDAQILLQTVRTALLGKGQ
ncbi:MAG TPA: sugar transferase [Rubricoccaceae bacterium]|nr:sugar transferase [Rubricoccaceae bacterium]